LPSPHSPCQNRLLAALPADEYALILRNLELAPMPLGHVLHEPGLRMSHVYFPTTAIVSLHYVMVDGAATEIAVVGREGIVGISLFMGGDFTTNRAVVDSAGYGYRLKRQLLNNDFDRAGPMQRLLLRYTQALLTQIAQTAVCNRHHSLEQQLCRCLLERLDRLPSNELAMTQELIANLLGVRREGVTEAAGRLQSAGLIYYSRGKITVVDRPGLAARVCECYEVVRNEFDRLLPEETPALPRFPTAATRNPLLRCHKARDGAEHRPTIRSA
jgi:CRP-like cAMP-binding protein